MNKKFIFGMALFMIFAICFNISAIPTKQDTSTGSGFATNECSMDYTNIAMTNKTNTFIEQQFITYNAENKAGLRIYNLHQGNYAYNYINFMNRFGQSIFQIGNGGDTLDRWKDSAFLYSTKRANALYIEQDGDKPIIIMQNGLEKVRVDGEGVKVSSLSGTGSAYACVNGNGLLYRSEVPCV